MGKIALLWILLLLGVSGCGQPGDLPIIVRTQNTGKAIISKIVYPNGYIDERIRPLEMVCYIDTSRFNPLNALDYTLKNNGVQFFDYVILGGAFIQSDANGYHLSMTDDLRNLLTQRKRLVVPLQEQGIKVMLGIQSYGDASFGKLYDEEGAWTYARSVYQHLELYDLDGAELYDYGADESVWPQAADYVPNEEQTQDEWLLEQWQTGADYLNNILYMIKQLYPANVRDNKYLFVRERNYGRFLPDDIQCTEDIWDFAGSSAQITYSFNPYPEQFPVTSRQRAQASYTVMDLADDIDDSSAFSWMTVDKYGPLMIALDGSTPQNIMRPFKDPTIPFDTYYDDFVNGSYQAIYYNNLQSLDQAKANPYFDWPDYDPNLHETDFFDEDGTIGANPKSVPQLYLFNVMSKLLFGEQVVCSGGNHQKDW